MIGRFEDLYGNSRRRFLDVSEVHMRYRKTSWAPALGALLCLFAIMGVGTARAATSAPEITLRVMPAQQLGDLPRIYRPSVMMAWADAEAVNAFLSLPGPLGAVRVTLEPLLTEASSLADFKARLAREAGGLKRVAERGADIIIMVARMPRWLAARAGDASLGQSGWTVREASPPRDYAGLEELGFAIATTINREHGFAPWYEFWNEPESKSFWSGSSDELFRAYDAFARGARRADPAAKVGGIAVSGWNERREGEPSGTPPMLRAFIERAARGMPLDFVSWHNFGLHPEEGWLGAVTVREWLRASGLPPQTPQFVTEWNRWRTFPEWVDPGRDTTEGAVFLLAALEPIEGAGIRGHTFAALQDFHSMVENTAFSGDFGLVTREPMIRKASFCAMQMLARLGSNRIAVEPVPDITAAEGVGVLATATPERIAILVYRYGRDPRVAAFRSLRQSGIQPRFEDLGLTQKEVEAFVSRKANLPAGRATPAVQAALERARAVLERVRDVPAPEVVVRPVVDGLATGGKYRLYWLDDLNCNPGAVYRKHRREGRPHGEALAAARIAEAFKPQQEGSGPLPSLRFAAQGAVLIEIDRAGR